MCNMHISLCNLPQHTKTMPVAAVEPFKSPALLGHIMHGRMMRQISAEPVLPQSTTEVLPGHFGGLGFVFVMERIKGFGLGFTENQAEVHNLGSTSALRQQNCGL